MPGHCNYCRGDGDRAGVWRRARGSVRGTIAPPDGR